MGTTAERDEMFITRARWEEEEEAETREGPKAAVSAMGPKTFVAKRASVAAVGRSRKAPDWEKPLFFCC